MLLRIEKVAKLNAGVFVLRLRDGSLCKGRPRGGSPYPEPGQTAWFERERDGTMRLKYWRDKNSGAIRGSVQP